jgi:hypothetical protein
MATSVEDPHPWDMESPTRSRGVPTSRRESDGQSGSEREPEPHPGEQAWEQPAPSHGAHHAGLAAARTGVAAP